MEARYFTDESGERVGVVLDIAEYEHRRWFAEEAAKTTRHSDIGFRGTEGSHRAWMPGTALGVWEIVAGHQEMGRQRFLEEIGISEDRLDAVLSYRRAYQDEVKEKIAENTCPLEYWRGRYPNLNIQSIEY